MAKGKEALASARRREQEAATAAEMVRADLSRARAEIVDLTRQLADQEMLRSEVARLRLQVEQVTGDEVERLVGRNAELVNHIRQLGERVGDIGKLWESALADEGVFNPENRDKLERFMALRAETEDLAIAWTPGEERIARSFGVEAMRSLQRARKGRPGRG